MSGQNSELNSLAVKITNLSAKRERLLQELSETENELTAATSKHNVILNLKVPILKLPAEVLSDIFILCKADQASFALISSHVCKQWRAAALSTPLLWSTFWVHNVESHLPKLETYLARSRMCLLDVTIHASMSNIHAVMDLLIPHCGRWLSLAICSQDIISNILVEYLRDASVPSLKYLFLTIGRKRPDITIPDTHPQIFCRGAPALRLVHLQELAFSNLLPPLTDITVLELSIYNIKVDPLVFISLLQGLPSLVHLNFHVQQFYELDDLSLEINPIEMTSLRTLRLSSQYASEDFLPLVELPYLETFIMEQLHEYDFFPFPSVKNLELKWCPDNEEEDLMKVILAYPSVACFYILPTTPVVYTLLTPTDANPEQILWPSLKTLKISFLEEHDIPKLQNMVSARIEYGCPLTELLFDEDSLCIVEKSSTLSWFKHRVTVGEHDPDYSAWWTTVGWSDPVTAICC